MTKKKKDDEKKERRPWVPYDAIVELPEWKVGEIVAGELQVSPRPASWHAIGSSTLGIRIGGPFQEGIGGPGGWWILDEPELHLGRDIVIPDIAGWRVERMPETPNVPYFTLAPDWICEFLSPSTERIDRSKKADIYARERVAHLWIVNPVKRSLETHRREGEKWLLLDTFIGDVMVRAEPFEAVELDLAAVWRKMRASGSTGGTRP